MAIVVLATSLFLLGTFGLLALWELYRVIQAPAIVDLDESPPQRKHFLLLAAILAAVAMYRSLVPPQFQPQEWLAGVSPPVTQNLAATDNPGHPSTLGDVLSVVRNAPLVPSAWFSNGLLAVPLGLLWMAVFTVDRQRRRNHHWKALPLVVILGSLLTLVSELAQHWINQRVPSIHDLLANACGLLIGSLAWTVCGQTGTDWLRSKTAFRRTPDRLEWGLAIYSVCFVLLSTLPLEVTMRGADVARKFRAGRLVFVPFSDSNLLVHVGLNLVLFIPLGMLAACFFTLRSTPLRSLANSMALASVAVLGVELAQLFVAHRYTSMTDVATGVIGVLLGAIVMHWLRAGETHSATNRSPVLLMLAVGYAIVVVIACCAPFQPVTDEVMIRSRFGTAFSPLLPTNSAAAKTFAWQASALMAIYIPLGILLALATISPAIPRVVRYALLGGAVLVAASVAFLVEMFQVYLPPKTATITDVALAATGAACGTLLVEMLFAAKRFRA